MKTLRTSCLGLLAGLLVTSVGCMVTPGNQQIISSRTTPVEFSGYTVHPGQKIELYAMNSSNQAWTKIGETTSSTKGFEHFGTQWYYWNKSIVIPKSQWISWGTNGMYVALVRGVADNNDLFTFEDGFYDYFDDYDSLEELYLEHGSPGGVEIGIWTSK